MPATVQIREKNGAGETATDKTTGTIRFKNADNATVDLNNPLVKPTAGNFDRSYQKWLRLYIAVGPAGTITAPKFYMSGSAETGQTIYAQTTNPGTYSTPSEPTSDTGYTDAFTYTSGSPKALDVANAGPFSSVGDFGDYLVMMMKIADSISAPGTLNSKTATFQWDET